MNDIAHAANQIRAHLAHVARLREIAAAQGLDGAVRAVKGIQARRFRASYRDFLAHPRRAPATRFFLDELYGDHDFAERDAQFARIAGALERLFPVAVAQLAVDMAEMHSLTESLDHCLAGHWLALGDGGATEERYLRCWRLAGQRDARERQLAVVQHMGGELQRLTHSQPLRLALRMMRRPAQASGLFVLQQFLENGLAAFATLGDASEFLDTISERERYWIKVMFDETPTRCVRLLRQELAEV